MEKNITMNKIEMFIIDEADHMFGIGFEEQMKVNNFF